MKRKREGNTAYKFRGKEKILKGKKRRRNVEDLGINLIDLFWISR